MLRGLELSCYLLASFSFPVVVQASPVETNVVDQQLDKLGIEDVKQFWDGLVTKYGGYLPESQKGSFMEFVKEKRNFYKRVDARFIKVLISRTCCKWETTRNAHYAHNFSALLQSLQSAFSKSSVSKIADAVVYMVLIIFALNSFMSS